MIALDPNQTFEFSLDIEAGKPRHRRTTFVSRFLTARQLAEIDRLTDDAAAAQARADLTATRSCLAAAALLSLVGIRVPAPVADELAPVHLDIQAPLPAAERAVLLVRPLSREHLKAGMSSLASAGEQPAKRIEAITQFLATCVDSTHRLGEGELAAAASMGELEEIVAKVLQLSRLALVRIETLVEDLTEEDLWDVVLRIIRHARLSELDRKKSALQSASAAARRSAWSALAGA